MVTGVMSSGGGEVGWVKVIRKWERALTRESRRAVWKLVEI
jgi:hypothetical protein